MQRLHKVMTDVGVMNLDEKVNSIQEVRTELRIQDKIQIPNLLNLTRSRIQNRQEEMIQSQIVWGQSQVSHRTAKMTSNQNLAWAREPDWKP